MSISRFTPGKFCLTASFFPLKMDGWKRIHPLGLVTFQGLHETKPSAKRFHPDVSPSLKLTAKSPENRSLFQKVKNIISLPTPIFSETM